MQAYKTNVTFPYTRITRTFKSERAVARMLSGNGKATSKLRAQIAFAADAGFAVRRNTLHTLRVQMQFDFGRAA